MPPAPPWAAALALIHLALHTILPSTTATWRPSPTAAAPLAATATPEGGLTLSARYVTWDGWFRDEHRLAAGKGWIGRGCSLVWCTAGRERERESARAQRRGEVFHSSFNLPLHHPFVSLSLSLQAPSSATRRAPSGPCPGT